MNAIEFVKECGIDVAKRTLNNAIDFGCAEIELFGGKYVFRTDDLKQIVDAFELVESKGGLVECKKYLVGIILHGVQVVVFMIIRLNEL